MFTNRKSRSAVGVYSSCGVRSLSRSAPRNGAAAHTLVIVAAMLLVAAVLAASFALGATIEPGPGTAAGPGVAHSEQGVFRVLCPTAEFADWLEGQAKAAGVENWRPAGNDDGGGGGGGGGRSICIRITFDSLAWWDGLRPRLTTCVITGGAEARPGTNDDGIESGRLAMSKIELRTTEEGGDVRKRLRFVNPITDHLEYLPLRGHCDPARPSWEWDGSTEAPTLAPSVLYASPPRWHYFVESGRIRYLADSPTGAPELIVDLPDIDEWTAPGFRLWCVYENPSDFPGKFVVRRWTDNRPGLWRYVAGTIEDARRVIPAGLNRIGRDSADAPCIVETWL